MELKTALGFGLLLARVILLGKMLRNWLGNVGILALAADLGVADVDAINLSLARMSQTDLAVGDAVIGIVIDAAVNNLVKGGMATVIGGGEGHGSSCWFAAVGEYRRWTGISLVMDRMNGYCVNNLIGSSGSHVCVSVLRSERKGEKIF